jgi:adenosylcobinamide-GDP ribazoletransferase
MFRSFWIAVQFLTVFRVRVEPEPTLEDAGEAAWAFPVVGAVIGLILIVFHSILAGFFPPLVTGVLTVGLWVVVTGGLHLDGWTDCCDAIPASVSPERRREILKDSRLGTFGALGLFFLVSLKIMVIGSGSAGSGMIFLAPVIGRAAMVVAAHNATHGGSGMAAGFISGLDRRSVTWAVVLALVPAVIIGWTGILAAAAAYLVTVGFRKSAESRLETVNGDVIGASCEVSETAALLIASMQW